MLAKYEFIQINSTIQDYSEYVKEIMLVKRYLKNKIIDLALEENFNLELDINKSYDRVELIFYNKDKDLEMKIEVKKRYEEHFV